jgi:outer membrane protein OmpA-like peptidoglycan-associated protein
MGSTSGSKSATPRSKGEATKLDQGGSEHGTHVAIFGAGITGLTAAHELVERGYRVEIFECAEPNPFEKICSVGGMARTQWWRTRRADPESRDRNGGDIDETLPINAELERMLELEIGFGDAKKMLEKDLPGDAKVRLDQIAELLAEDSSVKVEVRGYTHRREALPYRHDAKKTDDDVVRANAVVAYLTKAIKKSPKYTGGMPELEAAGYGFGHRGDWTKSDAERCCVDFHTIEDWIPGEHGFRFFPSFYPHLRDTMKRTPVSSDSTTSTGSTRTVHDNIIPTTSQGINPENAPSFELPRRRVRSAQEFFDVLQKALAGSGSTLSDMALMQVKLFKYMTSCPARRRGYEDVSWWDFMEGERYSPQVQKNLDRVPQLLVAMTSKRCDTRTYGNIQVQILKDQLSEGENTDGTLNGPTNTAWLDHWRRFLESQGVIFRHGELRGFEVLDDDSVWPVVDLSKDPAEPDSEPDRSATVLCRDYYVVALPIEEVARIVKGSRLEGRDFDRLRKLELGDPTVALPNGALQHISGVQYYFRGDIKFLPGHTVYPDSAWGLSSVFQPQFWATKRGWWDGYRGLLSVDIGDWYSPVKDPESRVCGRAAWHCTRKEIIEEVWRQIKKSIDLDKRIDRNGKPLVEDPILAHLDENITFDSDPRTGRSVPKSNETRFFINDPGVFSQRPGELGSADAPGYQVYYDKLLLAGTYMQTYFRLTTMEAANESARHAVNAILANDGFGGDRCAIFDPEENEIDNLKYLVDLDAELHRQGLDHFIDILGLMQLPSEWLSGERIRLPMELLGNRFF